MTSDSRDRQLLRRPSAPAVHNSNSSYQRRKSVRFSPLVAQYEVTPYSEVHGLHPRTFDFDAHGNRVAGVVKTTPKVAVREFQNLAVKLDRTVEPIYFVGALPRDDRSREEECRSESSRSGREKRVTDYADNTSQGAKARQSARDVRTFSAGLAQATRARLSHRSRSIS